MEVQPSQEDIIDLRNSILERISTASESIHPKDVQRIKDEDNWLKRFLMHHDLNKLDALQMLWSTLLWRKEFGVNDLNVKMEIILGGGFFPRGIDIDGAPLFIFNCKKYVKNQHNSDELKKCVIYWMERLERENEGKPITLFFDMEGCGLSNMDLEFTKYLIGLFKEYYPYFLNYVLVFEMPWVLSAAFKIIKSWLPEKAVKKIKFISKKDLKNWVPMDQALASWGGEDNYTFNFIPEASNEDIVNHNNNKKVRFDDGELMSEIVSTSNSGEDVLLSVSPTGFIKFIKEDQEYTSNISLQNTTALPVSFKVKTTSPEKFRVRPGYGCLAPGASTTVTICLLTAYRSSNIAKDKFLILGTTVENPDLSSEELTTLWKSISIKKENQIHLRCFPLNDVVTNNAQPLQTENDTSFIKLSNHLQTMQQNQEKIYNSMRMISYIQISMIVLLIAAVLYLVKKDFPSSKCDLPPH